MPGNPSAGREWLPPHLSLPFSSLLSLFSRSCHSLLAKAKANDGSTECSNHQGRLESSMQRQRTLRRTAHPALNEFGALSGQAQASLKQAAGVPCVEHDRIRPRLPHAYIPDAVVHKLTEDALRGVVLKPIFDALLAFAGNHYRREDLVKLNETHAVSLAAEEAANEWAILVTVEELSNRLIRRANYQQKRAGNEASIAIVREIQDKINEVKSWTEGLVNADFISITPATSRDEDSGKKATDGDDDGQGRKRSKTA